MNVPNINAFPCWLLICTFFNATTPINLDAMRHNKKMIRCTKLFLHSTNIIIYIKYVQCYYHFQLLPTNNYDMIYLFSVFGNLLVSRSLKQIT